VIKKWLKMLLIFFSVLILVVGLPRIITILYARGKIVSIDDAPSTRVAIVFGAGLRRDGSPTPVLKDRVATASELYFAGKVDKLLMSGDNRFVDYNEPGGMKNFAVDLGVPAEDIVLDYAGRRTYDTCYRASEIFQVDQALLVTQSFHLPRAIYTCRMLGVDARGVNADRRVYDQRSRTYWNIREIPAAFVALLQVHLTRPEPVLGEQEPIFPESTGD
jgi:SanA protein